MNSQPISPQAPSPTGPAQLGVDAVRARLRKRNAAARRFRLLCQAAVACSLGFLFLLLATLCLRGYQGFFQTLIEVDIFFDPQVLDPDGSGDAEVLASANYGSLIRSSLQEILPDTEGRRARRALGGLVSLGAAYELQNRVAADPALVGTTQALSLVASDEVDLLIKGELSREVEESERRLSDLQIAWVDALDAQGRVRTRLSRYFFTSGDSREPEMAGVWGAVVGSAYTMLITLLLSFPLGVATAVYLEEFAGKNRWTDLIEININNLAAVPSIVYGLLGLALFLNVFGLPRSAPLVGGLVLTLMTLPIIIIASRAALRAVPPSIREAAYGLGASPMQALVHHILPLALPGMLTGTIIGMARALGETAPLLMIGMVAFIVDVPQGPLDPATVLPVQVYLWADSPERAFEAKTSAAILVLLTFLILMNTLAVALRKKAERRW